MNSPDELRPDAVLRRLVLQELYRHNESHHWLVKPEAFDPPIAKHVIGRIGIMLKSMDLLKSNPGQDLDGYWMQLSVKGKLHCEKGLSDEVG